MLKMNDSTIAAVATPFGSGGIGIIKISGKDSLAIAASIFCRSLSGFPLDISQKAHYTPLSFFRSHRLYHGYIVDPDNGEALDEVLLSVMKAPRSYTREDVVEINTHSGTVVLSAIMKLVLKRGARPAEPGEFTKRAYINGRIDLTQAEAVIDIINAKTEKSLAIATAQMQGAMKECVESIRNTLLHVLTETEAAIDFPDDVAETIDMDELLETVQRNVVDRLQDVINQYHNAHFLKEGLRVAIIGKPNVGKSTLMNSLIQKDRVIVTPLPGTTRDLIEETVTIHDFPIIVADTAGLHETDNQIEFAGISKTHDCINSADCILFVIDASSSLDDNDYEIYDRIKSKRLILVINKSDLVDDGDVVAFPDSWKEFSNVKTSALYNKGLRSLKDLIAKVAKGERHIDHANAIIPNLRHKLALERALNASSLVVEGLKAEESFELIALDIREALDSLGEIIGFTDREDVLDQIFSNFCIGK
jgi:tRNA modification GTPase